MNRWNRWTALRGALLAASLALLGYVTYRYALYLPPDHGTLYGKIFPLSVLLAASGIGLALQPFLLRGLTGAAGTALRLGLTGVAGIWMATGLLCAASLARGVVAAPLGGTFDLMHMVSDHLFLPLAVVALAWMPARLATRLGSGLPLPAPSGAGYGATTG